ncbi:hypothetical protein [Oceaniglobus trochenteri]|uniref:hypothetical protein n=1 Tax=Oceaniglobus trochenteri TaxID=2763260 RepID=UPI001CFFC73F|nr:hypothetical protein [Oceaniglobus trochenteri]
MARLFIVLLFVAILAAMAIGVISAIGRAADAGRTRLAQAEMGNGAMQRISFVLLVALIFYVSIWGAA